MTEDRSPSASPVNQIILLNQGVPVRLDKFLYDRLPGKTRSYIQKLIRGGSVNCAHGRSLKPSTKIQPGETVVVRMPPPPPSTLEPQYVHFGIFYEDEDLVALNKPPGVAVHPAPGLTEPTLVHGLLWRLRLLSRLAGADRPGIVHRLDRDTSGVMIVAKNDMAHHQLSLKFKAREMHKSYTAICRIREPIEAGVIDVPIGRSLRNRKKMAVRYDGGRAAITEYQVRQIFGSFALVDASPRSGRTHQIRVHLSFMGLPIVCDQLYGAEKRLFASSIRGKPRVAGEKPLLRRQALHARRLSFTHPRTGRRLRLEAALPEDMQRVIGILRRLCPA